MGLHEFLGGCLLSLVPSLLGSVAVVYINFWRRCKLQAICGTLSSVGLIAEWSFFPACVVPSIGVLNMRWYTIFWLTPVVMPYVLLFSFALESGAYSLGFSVMLVFMSSVFIHLSLIRLGG